MLGLWRIAAADPDRCAVVDPAGERTSFGELAGNSNRVSNGLLALGAMHGDAVAVVLDNSRAFVEILMGAMQIGRYVVPVNHHSTADDIAYILKNSDARALFTERKYADACRFAADAVKLSVSARVAVGGASGFADYETWRDARPADRPPETAAGAIMNYTSGTTGRPKGVRKPLAECDADSQAALLPGIVGLFGVPYGNGAHLVTSPLYHTAVVNMAVSSLHAGHTLVIMYEWDAETALQLIEEHSVTTTHMVATHFHRMLALPDEVRNRFDTRSMTHAIHGAVATPVEIKQRMLDWWGPVIYEYYGSSEVGATMVAPEAWLEKPGTVGRPWPMVRLEILDDDGKAVPAGEKGWIYMENTDEDFQYHKDAAKTEKVKRGRLICVGDIGYVDEDGDLFLCGRDAEIIVSGGVNIYPAASEGRLLSHPAVADVAVVGVPDEEYGEQVRAVVVPAEGHQAGEALAAELIEFCREGLSHISCPRSVDFTDALPRDPNGKLFKHKVREPYWAGHGRRI